MNRVVRVLVVTDVRLYQEGLARSLGDRSDLEVVGTASEGSEALALVRALSPEAVLLDMTMRDSLATARAIAALDAGTHVVAFAVSERDEDVLACAEAGVEGYVTRAGSCEQLVAVLHSVGRQELLCSPRIAASLFRRVASGHRGGLWDELYASLTARELEVVRLVARGFTNKEVAHALHIEVSTVKNHVHHVLSKLHLDRRAKIAALLRGAERPSLAQWMAGPRTDGQLHGFPAVEPHAALVARGSPAGAPAALFGR